MAIFQTLFWRASNNQFPEKAYQIIQSLDGKRAQLHRAIALPQKVCPASRNLQSKFISLCDSVRLGRMSNFFNMERMPDYSQHSLDELYDVQQHINKEKYPDIYDRLLQEIENQEQRQSSSSSRKPSRLVTATVAFTLACLGLYWGGWAIFMIIAHLTPPEPGTRNDFEPWFGVLMGCIWLFVALLCFIPTIVYLKRGKN